MKKQEVKPKSTVIIREVFSGSKTLEELFLRLLLNSQPLRVPVEKDQG